MGTVHESFDVCRQPNQLTMAKAQRQLSSMFDVQGKVLFGSCGWSDESIKACGRFYPVDSSSYAIPRPATTAKWVKRTPTGFVFHFKAFGLFPHQRTAVNTLPFEVRQQLPAYLGSPTGHVSVQQLRELGLEQALWDAFHAMLQPVRAAGCLGCVVFQMQLSFKPSEENRAYVAHCRAMLDPGIAMAVEFRNRAWFAEPSALEQTAAWMSSQGLVLVAADELRHETFMKDRQQTGLPPGQVREILPIALHGTNPAFFYVRLHRRHGTHDRIIPAEEIQGTDWEDAPVVNAKALTEALPAALRFDYKAAVRQQAAKRPSSIQAMFMAAGKRQATTRTGAGSPAAAAADLVQQSTSNHPAATTTPLDSSSEAARHPCPPTLPGNVTSAGPTPAHNKTQPPLQPQPQPQPRPQQQPQPQSLSQVSVLVAPAPAPVALSQPPTLAAPAPAGLPIDTASAAIDAEPSTAGNPLQEEPLPAASEAPIALGHVRHARESVPPEQPAMAAAAGAARVPEAACSDSYHLHGTQGPKALPQVPQSPSPQLATAADSHRVPPFSSTSMASSLAGSSATADADADADATTTPLSSHCNHPLPAASSGKRHLTGSAPPSNTAKAGRGHQKSLTSYFKQA